MAALAALPSASVALVVTRTVTKGLMNGIAVIIGIILGDLVFIVLAVFGLSVVAETMSSLFIVIKYLGAIYLIWLGYTLINTKNVMSLSVDKELNAQNLSTSFIAGFILTLGDIKAIVFYASLLPIFIDLKELVIDDVLIVILIMIVSIGLVKMCYVFLATKVISLTVQTRQFFAMRKVAGVIVLMAGSYLIVKT